MRGILAVGVCVYHGIWVLHLSQIDRIASVPIFKENNLYEAMVRLFLGLVDGDFAVVIFFVMSGAVLQLSLRRAGAVNPWVQSGEFVVARVLRIYPALITTLLLFWGSFAWLEWQVPSSFHVYFTPRELLENITLHKLTMYGVTWSLRVEMLMIPFILLAYFTRRRFGDFALVVLALLSVLLYENHSLLFGWQDVTGHLLPFALGFMVPSAIGENTAACLRGPGSLVAVILLELLRLLVPYHMYSAVLLHAFCGYLLVVGVYYGRWPQLVAALSTPSMRFLGRISYSFYLLNPIFLEYLARVAYNFGGYRETNGTYLEWGMGIGVTAALLTLPLAHWSERWIEAPANRLAKRIRVRSANSAAGAVTESRPA